jgi:putative membrane protein
MADEMQDPRTYFAAERTFLAWIRTGLGLMGIGFAVARFSLFLREFQQSGAAQTAAGHGAAVHKSGASLYAGVALVGLGVLVNVAAILHHVSTVKELRTGTWVSGRVSKLGIALGLVLAAVGMGMGIYLLLWR